MNMSVQVRATIINRHGHAGARGLGGNEESVNQLQSHLPWYYADYSISFLHSFRWEESAAFGLVKMHR